MEDLIEQTGCGSKSESIMMRILRSAMDRAQEKLQLKDKRQIEFLHEQTTFYQLAAILVEGSMKILEEEDESEILESSCRKMISDLIEIREGLEGRIRDMKRLIMEKDREFRERLDNELRLREALELTERESIQLYEKIGPVIMMMKDSVDEQVLDIKQKLEDEKMILDSEIRARTWRGYSPNLMPGSLNNGQGSVVLLEDEKMILNTEKRARRSLSSPNLRCDILDSERRARRSHSNPNLYSMMILNVERRAKRSRASSPNLSPSSLNKKLFKELELVTFEDEKMILNSGSRARRSRASSPNPNPNLDSLDKERGLVPMEDDQFMSSGIDILKQTLDLVFGRVQLEEVVPLEKQLRKGIKREVDSILVKGFARDIQTKFDIELKKRDGLVKGSWFDFIDEMKSLFHELKDFFSRNDVSNVQPCFPKSRRTNSEPNLDFDFTQNLLENNGDEVGGSHHIWKIIKSHESIIQRQREQRSLLARDTLQREGTSSWIKRNEDINAMERLIQDVIVRLENFTQRKHKVSDLKGVGCRSRSQERRGRVPKPHRVMDRTSTTIQSFEAEIKKLQEERDGLCFQIAVIEDTYQLLFRGVMKDFSCCGAKETASDELEGSNRHRIQIHYMESAIREDIFALIFEEMVKQWEMSLSDLARGPKVPQEDSRDSPILQDYIENLLREDLYKIYIREMAEEWRLEALKLFDFEVRMPQPRVKFQEEIDKELKIRSQSDPARDSKTPQEDSHFSSIQDCTECLLREEIFKIYFRETTEAWRSEALAQFNFEAHTPQSRVMFQEENWKMSQSGSVRCSKTPQEDLHCGPVQDCTECLLREEIYKIYFKETTQAWKSEALKQFDFEARSPQSRVMSPHETPQEAFRLSPILEDYVESLLREEIHKIYFKEMTKAWSSQVLNHFDFEAPTPQSRRSSKTETTLQEETPKQWKTSQSNSARISKTPQEDFRCSPAEDCMKCLLREEVYKIYLTEMIKSWRSSQESKHTDFEARTPQSRRAQACQEGTPRSATPRSRGGDGESSLIHKVDSLLKSLELEENLMLTASSLIKEHSVSNSLVILDCEETEERAAIEWLITDDESTFCSVSEKLERALQQLHTTKELLAELEESLEVSDDGGEYYENSEFNNILRLQDESTSPCLGLQGVGETDWSENVLEIVKRFRFLVDDVEVELYENLEGKCLRLEALKHKVDALTQPVAWIKTRKLLYEKAFISRCGNLKLAETEVDLLGDQVETLLSLLERIYQVLSRDARVLSTYFEVYDILKLIKIELNGGRSSKPKSQIAHLSSISPKSLPASTIRQHSILLTDGNTRLASNHIF